MIASRSWRVFAQGHSSLTTEDRLGELDGPRGAWERSSGRLPFMPFAVTLVELLGQLAGAELSFRREADLLGVSAVVLPGGRQILIIERVYRDGTGILDGSS